MCVILQVKGNTEKALEQSELGQFYLHLSTSKWASYHQRQLGFTVYPQEAR